MTFNLNLFEIQEQNRLNCFDKLTQLRKRDQINR